MTRETKSAVTIRRRKLKYKASDLDRFRSNRPSSPTPLEEIHEFNEEDEGYLFDDEVLGPSVIKKIMSSEKTLFLSLVSMRIVNSLLVQTSFVPDEYWQSLEVAHNIAFGYGYETWEWKNGLRGYLYPSIFALLYKMLAIFGLDNRLLLIKLPRILQALIAACGDFYLYKFSWLLCDRATAQWTLFCQTVNWFMLYCTTRTLTNSTETALVTAALYYFPWPGIPKNSRSVRTFLWLAALSIIIRPTAAVIWILLCSWHLQNSKQHLLKTLKSYVFVGCMSLGVSLLVDRMFYSDWTFVQYNFLKFNVLSGGGSFYGTHPWHWYLTQGFPVVMALHILPFCLGAWKAKNKVPLFVILWTVFIYSFLAHKEFRFVMPVLPLSFHYCGVYFQSLCKKPKLKKKQRKRAISSLTKTDSMRGSQESLFSGADGSESTGTEISSEQSMVSTEMSTDTSGIVSDADLREKDNPDKETNAKKDGSTNKDDITSDKCEMEDIDPDIAQSSKKQDLSTNEILAQMEERQRETHKTNLSKAKIFVIILLLTNIPAAMYFSLIHQRGSIIVMKYLHDASQEKNIDVMFLMPCHSTPYYSYIHRNISMRFLTCEPNLHHQENYTDQADVFFGDPIGWLKTEYAATSKPWPTHLVYFSPLQKRLETYLAQSGYRDCASFFHTHLPEGRVGTHILVSCR